MEPSSGPLRFNGYAVHGSQLVLFFSCHLYLLLRKMNHAIPVSDWLCTNRRAIRLSPGASGRIDTIGTALTSGTRSDRISRQSWVRYRREIEELPEPPADVTIEPVSESLMDNIRRSEAGKTENQLRSAIRFWDGGLKSAFVWLEKGEPLCMQWLLDHSHFVSLPKLGNWAGMFPPMPAGSALVENIYSFAAARERRPGAATRLAIAVMHEARRLGYRELRTHVAQSNLGAHRWARRIGLVAYGVIDRYSIKIPGMPITYLCHHQSCEMRHLQPLHRPGK